MNSLTDETTRENLEKYGHPDGRQDVSMGIALPQWIVERKNNVWVLGVYGLLFGGALPALVVRVHIYCPCFSVDFIRRVGGGLAAVRRPKMEFTPNLPLYSSNL